MRVQSSPPLPRLDLFSRSAPVPNELLRPLLRDLGASWGLERESSRWLLHVNFGEFFIPRDGTLSNLWRDNCRWFACYLTPTRSVSTWLLTATNCIAQRVRMVQNLTWYKFDNFSPAKTRDMNHTTANNTAFNMYTRGLDQETHIESRNQLVQSINQCWPPRLRIGGLHCCHGGGQNKRKFAHIVCIRM